MFSWVPLTLGVFSKLYVDSKAAENSLVPLYWMSLKTRHALLAQLLIAICSMSLLTFKDYINQSEDLIASYQAKSTPEGAEPKGPIGPIKPMPKEKSSQPDLTPSKTPNTSSPSPVKPIDEKERALDILADPSK